MINDALFNIDPLQLVEARTLCHAACQWPSKAARANLAPAADDSHSNLGWQPSLSAMVSHSLDADKHWQLGFSFAEQALLWIMRGEVRETFPLVRLKESAAQSWVDSQLREAGLQETAAAQMPYTLDPIADYSAFTENQAEASALGAWFNQAYHALAQLSGEYRHLAVAEPALRCWPHHFDLAVLFTLETGDPESAKSVGVGLSPGDGSYAQPYLYCSPWPIDAEQDVRRLPAAPEPFSWHTQGFVSLIATASSLQSASWAQALTNAVETARAVIRG